MKYFISNIIDIVLYTLMFRCLGWICDWMGVPDNKVYLFFGIVLAVCNRILNKEHEENR